MKDFIRVKDFIRSIASLPRRQKQIVLVLMDICILPLMMWLVYAIRLARPNVRDIYSNRGLIHD